GAIDAGCAGVNAAFLLQSVICLVAAVLTIVMVRDKATDAAKADPTGVRRQTLETIMKRDVFTVPDTATVAQAMQLLTGRGISAAPIVDADNHVVGMISDGDIIRAMAKRGRSYMDPIAMIINSEKLDPDFSHKLDEVMNSPVTAFATMNVISVDVHDSFDEVCRVLGENHLRKAPVLDGGKLVGVVNRSDVTTYALGLYAAGMGATQA
ncbi:MAG: CBS domain-containing protein, partial [Eggerthellaceae bacterium]|nr:CBS domain-containing protein [Eggerthellaceae bacterium]